YSTVRGIFATPRNISKEFLSNDDLLNYQIDQYARSLVGFKVVTTRSYIFDTKPAREIVYEYETQGKLVYHTIERYIFSSDRVYQISGGYVVTQPQSESLVRKMMDSFRLL
ncbi:MAG: hypothetical protein RLZZ347_807, partial [Candidatus Parcubacteria bacterium]